MESSKPSLFPTIISMMISPASAIKSSLSGLKWYFSIAVSSIAFALFFVQTGLDLYKTGQKSIEFVFISGVSGMLYGMLIIPLIGILAWLILKLAKTDKDIKWSISAFCLSYSGALVFGIIGLCFSLFFNWKTSVAFGMTGVLWAIGPMIVTIREMTKGAIKTSILLSTFINIIVLLSWSIFGRI